MTGLLCLYSNVVPLARDKDAEAILRYLKVPREGYIYNIQKEIATFLQRPQKVATLW
jgi:hypothetical protein